MRRFLFAFLLGTMAGVGGSLYVQHWLNSAGIEQAQSQVTQGAARIKSSVESTLSNLTAEVIREELAATGMVVREQARQAGQMIMDATANARMTTTIKAKLFAEPNLPAMRINVDSAGGLVTLSGTVNTSEQVARAVRIALETEGVAKVISTIQVHPDNAR